MPQDTYAPPLRDTSATISLRMERYLLMTRVIGATTPGERAELIGVDRKTIFRAEQRGQFGRDFMAAAVAAFRQHTELLQSCGLSPTLDELFEVQA